MKLTEKQRRFVDYYVETGNASEAARRAGYSEKTAGWIGQENLQKPTIKAAVDARLRELEGKRIAKADEVLQFLTSILRGKVKEERVVVEGTGEGRSDARIITVQVSARDASRRRRACLSVTRCSSMPKSKSSSSRSSRPRYGRLSRWTTML